MSVINIRMDFIKIAIIVVTQYTVYMGCYQQTNTKSVQKKHIIINKNARKQKCQMTATKVIQIIISIKLCFTKTLYIYSIHQYITTHECI